MRCELPSSLPPRVALHSLLRPTRHSTPAAAAELSLHASSRVGDAPTVPYPLVEERGQPLRLSTQPADWELMRVRRL